MKTFDLNPTGPSASPGGQAARPRRRSVRHRVLAAALAILMATTVIATGVFSLGAYCLTSDGGDTRQLPPRR